MTTHLCRDLLGLSSGHDAHSYIFSLFVRRVLGYTYVGDTNFGINAVGSLLIATGDTTPTSTPTWAVGHKAGINYGSGLEHDVGIPSSDYTVSGSDVNRILVLKSTANPKHNSGLFRITAVDTVNNRVTIDYRSTTYPPAEADDSMEWYIYEVETSGSAPVSGAVNAGSGYHGNGTSTTSRIILQSPHTTGWQIRVCNETATDYNNYMCCPITLIPGFDGDGAGDFAIGGRHLHTAQWHDSSTYTLYAGATQGVGSTGTATYRYTILGDDTGQAIFMVMRIYSGSSSINQMFLCGLPDNEPTPLPSDDVSRLFVMGDGEGGNNGSNLNNIDFLHEYFNTGSRGEGMAFGAGQKQPITATYGAWGYLYGAPYTTSPAWETTAADSVYSGTTDLMDVSLFAGTCSSWYGSSAPFPYEPRLLGTAPYVRQGRVNFGEFTLTTDAAWQHLRNGVFMSWGGPEVVP